MTEMLGVCRPGSIRALRRGGFVNSGRLSRRELSRSQRGAVLVEAALVLPVMVVIVVGISEFGLLFSTTSTATASSRSGARLAATMFQRPTAAPNDMQAASLDQIVAATSADLKVLNNAVPVGMAVYKVQTGSTSGEPASGRPGKDMVGGCGTECIVYKWNGTKMVKQRGSWVNVERCKIALVDSIGIYVQVEHSYITGMFGTKRTVEGHTVMRLEPIPTDQCGPG